MCNVALVQVMQVATTALGQNAQARAVARNARAAEADAYAGLGEQQLQINHRASDQMVERSRQALREQGTLSAIFADTGLAGNSQGRLAAVAAGDALRDQDALERNRAAEISTTTGTANEIAARTQSTINSARRPSLIGTGLQIAAIGAEEYQRRNPPKK